MGICVANEYLVQLFNFYFYLLTDKDASGAESDDETTGNPYKSLLRGDFYREDLTTETSKKTFLLYRFVRLLARFASTDPFRA